MHEFARAWGQTMLEAAEFAKMARTGKYKSGDYVPVKARWEYRESAAECYKQARYLMNISDKDQEYA